MHGKYLLYSHPHSRVFTLKQAAQDWEREFTSVFDAVSYARSLPDSRNATLVVFNTAGDRLVELRVHEEVLLVPG